MTYRWLHIRWPQRLTSEHTCPRCGCMINSWQGGSDTSPWFWLIPCGHKAIRDPYTRQVHAYPPHAI